MENNLYELKAQLMSSFFRIKKICSAFPIGGEYKDLVDINMSEFVLMKGIVDNSLDSDENTCISDIQSNLFITKAAISQKLGALEKKGYICRDIDKHNRRNLIITLTPKGKEALVELEKSFDCLFSKIILQVGEDDIKQFVRIINRLADTVKDINN